jgi:hypothetical protein
MMGWGYIWFPIACKGGLAQDGHILRPTADVSIRPERLFPFAYEGTNIIVRVPLSINYEPSSTFHSTYALVVR